MKFWPFQFDLLAKVFRYGTVSASLRTGSRQVQKNKFDEQCELASAKLKNLESKAIGAGRSLAGSLLIG